MPSGHPSRLNEPTDDETLAKNPSLAVWIMKRRARLKNLDALPVKDLQTPKKQNTEK